MNSPELVVVVLEALRNSDCPCILFGGWAEEALGLRHPASHGDIDLLLSADDFSKLDALLSINSHHSDWREIERKRFHHKRAFLVQDVLVEILLVQSEYTGFVTWFWGDVRFDWQRPLACKLEFFGHGIDVATAANLSCYRTKKCDRQPGRWKHLDSLIGPTPG